LLLLALTVCSDSLRTNELPANAGERPSNASPDQQDTSGSPTDTANNDTGTHDTGPAAEPLDCTTPVVNGHTVAEPACSWLDSIGRSVVPELLGTRDERLDHAAVVAWWSLKEGVLFLDNPLVYSNCGSGAGYIDALEVCAEGYAWQVGLSGVQVPTFTESTATSTATELFPDQSTDQVLRTAAELAGLSAADVDAVASSEGDLRTSWLLRTSAVGFTLQVDIVERECVEGSYSWCYGTGWSASANYAPDREGAEQAMADIRALLGSVAP